jgi:hypothetical protein
MRANGQSECSFKFLDEELNRRLVSSLKRARVPHRLDGSNAVHFSNHDEGAIENDVISPIRSSVFEQWQVLTCPADWVPRYKAYMLGHGVPFKEELIDGNVAFLLPGNVKPHHWQDL